MTGSTTPLARAAVLLAGALTLVVPARADGQQAVVIGVVRDTAGVAIPLAEAVLVGAKRSDRASDRGWFVLDSLHAGTDMLIVRAIGYRVQRLPVTLHATDTLELEVVLGPQTQVLPELIVKAYGRELTGVAATAAQRMLRNGAPASGLITRHDIETWGRFDLANVLRRAGLIVKGARAGCPVRGGVGMTLFIDGAQVPVDPEGAIGGGDPGDLPIQRLPVDNIEAIEVYRSIATRPAEFNPSGALGCLILIWTRR